MSVRPSDRRLKALALLERLEPGAPGRVAKNLDDFHPEALEILLGFAFTDVILREGIELKTREMLTVAMLYGSASSHPFISETPFLHNAGHPPLPHCSGSAGFGPGYVPAITRIFPLVYRAGFDISLCPKLPHSLTALFVRPLNQSLALS